VLEIQIITKSQLICFINIIIQIQVDQNKKDITSLFFCIVDNCIAECDSECDSRYSYHQ